MRLLRALIAVSLLSTGLAACASDYYDNDGGYYYRHRRDRDYYGEREYYRDHGDYYYRDGAWPDR